MNRLVVIEFTSMEHAESFYHSHFFSLEILSKVISISKV